jgi:hypothetical protein
VKANNTILKLSTGTVKAVNIVEKNGFVWFTLKDGVSRRRLKKHMFESFVVKG